ncbi:MAG: general secretion pathway protein E [Gammaproteobacteria bacterium]|jgi:general secretion pathway protein E
MPSTADHDSAHADDEFDVAASGSDDTNAAITESTEALIKSAGPVAPALEPNMAAKPVVRPPFAFAKRNGVLAGEVVDGKLELICRPDVTLAAILETQRFTGYPPELLEVPEDEFNRRLQRAYEGASDNAMHMAVGLDEDMGIEQAVMDLPPEDLLESEDDAPIIRLINAILTEAIKEGASDIHIEQFEDRLVVRFRVDGVMREVLEPSRGVGPLLISRIKVMARLDIAEKRIPQDGRISLRIAGRAVDVRVSTLPSAHGERVVLRLLDKQAGRLDLTHLGMDPGELKRLQDVIAKPHGIMLVTGPTGSGKTTTLYAGLGELNDKRRNIMTVEDPVEYYLDGVAQTQVNTKVNMTFARGLRAILRQDPDVVMIGEIRDLETAEIAVQASLTGHMVFSTLHTNTAIGSVTRLRDMGVEPFLLSSSLVGLLAQRLVRRLCECKQTAQATDAEAKLVGHSSNQPLMLYKAHGCDKCGHSGYRGRLGIYELVNVDSTMRDLIHDGGSEGKMNDHARSQGPSLAQDGFDKAVAGITTIEEVMRVTRAI